MCFLVQNVPKLVVAKALLQASLKELAVLPRPPESLGKGPRKEMVKGKMIRKRNEGRRREGLDRTCFSVSEGDRRLFVEEYPASISTPK